MNFIQNITNFCNKKECIDMIVRQNEYVELLDSDGNTRGGILVHSNTTRDIFLSHIKASREEGISGHNGVISSAIIDNLGSMTSIVASTLQSGGLMQIIGTPTLLEGIRNGTMSLMNTASGQLGTVVSSASKKIVGQLRFKPASIAPIVAPIAIWQILNAVAGVYHLSKINARLDKLQRSLERITIRHQANAYGRLHSAIATLEEIENEYNSIGRFSQDMVVRLSLATQEIQNVFYEQSFLINRFQQKSADIVAKTQGKSGAMFANQIIEEEANEYILDASLYIAASRVTVASDKAWLMHDLEHVPEYVGKRISAIENEVKIMQEAISPLATIEELQNHAEDCLGEMNWFGRELLNRKLKKEIKQRNLSYISENEDNKIFSEEEISLIVWKDSNDKMNVVSIACAIG